MNELGIDDNIEDKVKNIISTKLKNGNNKLNDNDKKTIEKLFELFPDLKKKFGNYLDPNQSNEQDDKTSIVFTEIDIDGVTFYKDIRGGLWNSKAELVGTVSKDQKSQYVFFDTKYEIKLDLENIFL